MRTFGFVTLLAGCLALLACSALAAVDQDRRQPPGERESQQPARELPQAFITSKRVVYGYGQPIDLTFSIATPKEGKVLPDFKIVRLAPAPDEGEPAVIVEPREVNGQHFWEAPGESFDGKKREGALPAGQAYTEAIADLREWYDLDAPGTYRVTFGGEWIDAEDERHALTSNTIIVRIARSPSEDEPWGEPTEGREIPLTEIWALDMPGTKPMNPGMRPVDPPIFNAPEGELVTDIVLLHMRSDEMRLPARDGFIVRGTGMEALRQAHSILVEKNEPGKVFRRGEQVTLVFFSKALGAYVHLDRVEDHGSLIQVSYKLVTHMTDEATSHIALIPLRLDQLGTVQVEIKPIVPEQLMKRPATGGYLRTHMAQSFQFTVDK